MITNIKSNSNSNSNSNDNDNDNNAFIVDGFYVMTMKDGRMTARDMTTGRQAQVFQLSKKDEGRLKAVKNLWKVQHPNVAKILHIAEEVQGVFIWVFVDVPPATSLTLLSQTTKMTTVLAMTIVKQVYQAMENMHSVWGVVHCNLTAENILFHETYLSVIITGWHASSIADESTLRFMESFAISSPEVLDLRKTNPRASVTIPFGADMWCATKVMYKIFKKSDRVGNDLKNFLKKIYKAPVATRPTAGDALVALEEISPVSKFPVLHGYVLRVLRVSYPKPMSTKQILEEVSKDWPNKGYNDGHIMDIVIHSTNIEGNCVAGWTCRSPLE